MVGKLIPWTLRLSTWACLLTVAGLLALYPKQAWIRGRIFQMEVRFECRRAENALLRELGLDAYFDPARYRLHTIEFRRFRAPIWLTILERQREDEWQEWGTHIWLKPDGSYLLPPITDLPTVSDRSVFPPWRLRLSGRSGELLYGAVLNSGVWNDQLSPCSVWIHRQDRWVNVLRIESEQGFPLEPLTSEGLVTALECDGRSASVVFPWNPLTETFDIPPGAADEITLLETLTDQTELNPQPIHFLTERALDQFIRDAELVGLRRHYAAAAAEYGYETRIAETILSLMADSALEAGNVQRATEIYTLNIELYPNSAEAYYCLGEVCEKKPDLESARSLYARAREIAVKTADPWATFYKKELDRVTAELNK